MNENSIKTILLVEDDAIIALGQKFFLEKYGYRVLTITTGENAVEIIRNEEKPVLAFLPDSRKEPLEKIGYRVLVANSAEKAIRLFLSDGSIDLVLMDIDLGAGMDGTQAAEMILRERDIPILFLSSHTEPDIVARTEKISSYGYVVKNSSITVLDASIKMAFKLFKAHGDLKKELLERTHNELGLEAAKAMLEKLGAAAADAGEFSQCVINTVREPLISLDEDLRVVTVSRSFYELFKVNPIETVGKLIYDLGNKQWDIPRLRELLEKILPQQTAFEDYEVEHDFTTIGPRIMLLNARQIMQASGKKKVILLAIEDVTERRTAEKKIRALLAEKVLILKEVHHRIKNSMTTISCLLGLQAELLPEPAAKEALRDAESRVQSMMVLYDKLYRSIDYGEVSARAYLSSLLDEILGNFPNGDDVEAVKQLEDFPVDVKSMQSVGIIVNELLTNIMKYAFPGKEKSRIVLGASLKGSNATIAVRDNGKGVPEGISFEKSTGFGLMLVRNLTEQLGGTIRMETGNGTAVILEFPLAP